ncbi:MAG TPA: hypothetical protein V6C86_16650 [Oculatellaceae cyanobacterium]
MTLLRAYLWNHKVILPNVVQTKDGFFADDGPIEVFDIANNLDWFQAATKKLQNGNDIVDTPDGSEEPGSAILERLDIVKWSTFELQAVMFTVHIGSRYVSLYKTGRGPDGMWAGRATEQRKFDPRVPRGILLDALAQDIIKQDSMRMPGTGLAVIQKNP